MSIRNKGRVKCLSKSTVSTFQKQQTEEELMPWWITSGKRAHTSTEEDTKKWKSTKIQVHLTWTRSLPATQKLQSATRHPKIWMAAESSNSHQVFSRDTHRTLSFQHEAVKLVDTRLPSPKPTSLQKGWWTKTSLSFLKNETSNKVHPTELCCLHLLSGWSHKCQKELKKGKHSIIDNLCRNNHLTNYHNSEFQQNKSLFSVRC